MDKLFANLHLVLIIGLVAAIALIACVHSDPAMLVNYVLRWLHVFFGITWIGLLYYFNFVQVPTMPKVPAELKKGVTGYIAPSALFFFRWAAAFTVLTGLFVAYTTGGAPGYLVAALTFEPNYRLIAIGMYLALIMAFNVWVLIWPNQKKVLGLVEADDAAKATAGKVALIASRANTLLSLPMLYAMTNANLG
jgi:uncharacterized membrane protein